MKKSTKIYLTAGWRIALGILVILSAACGMVPTAAPARTSAAKSGTATVSPAVPRASQVVQLAPTNTPQPTPTSAIAVAPDSLNGVRLAFWHPWAGERGAALDVLVEEFNATNQWGLRVEATGFAGWGALEEQLAGAITARALPEITTLYNASALTLDPQGQHWADLSAYLQDPIWGITSVEQSDFVPAFWQQDVLPAASGQPARRIGLPWYGNGWLLFYNRAWARQLGYEAPPANLVELREQVCAASAAARTDTLADNNGKGGWMVTSDPAGWSGWLAAFGAQLTSPDGRAYQLNSTEAIEALRFMEDLAVKGCAWRAEQDSLAQPAFVGRQALVYLASLADIPAQQTAWQEQSRSDEWLALPIPSGQGQQVFAVAGPALLAARGQATSELGAWLFVRWLTDPEQQTRWLSVGPAQGGLPVRFSSAAALLENGHLSAQQAAVLEQLDGAHAEPAHPTWSIMRRSLSEAVLRLFVPPLTPETNRASSLANQLQQLADEIAQHSP